MKGQPWIGAPGFDLAFILGPGFVTSLLVLAAPEWFTAREASPLLWAALGIGVDMTHVYATLYRTYFDAAEFRRARTLYTLAPLLGWLGAAMLYRIGPMVFWRCLAYFAAWHFVRQQYGLMMLYGRWERQGKGIDQAAIYAAVVYPLIWWHWHPRQFAWYEEGDFFSFEAPTLALADVAGMVYGVIMAAYVAKEAALIWRSRRVNWPRKLLLAGTALSWWVGVMTFDSDLVFTTVIVVAHGIPYTAMVWAYGRQLPAATMVGVVPAGRLFSLAFVPVFVLVPLVLAYVEDGVWYTLVYGEDSTLFRIPGFSALPLLQSHEVLSLVVPLLALPQITHYILDGFIWRRKHFSQGWRASLAHKV